MKFEEVINLLKKLTPKSIFLYGLQVNKNTNSKSDYEIGIIFEDEKYISRSAIKKLIPDNKYAVYPFKLNELKSYNIDTPFQQNIYILSLISGNAKTIYGDIIIETLTPPEISVMDLLMDTSFNLGYALTAVRVMRTGNKDLANELMYKSMFYTTRNMLYAKTGKIINGYNNIYKEALKLNIPAEYQDLLEASFNLRNETIKEIPSSLYYKNISYINKYAIPILKKS